MQNPRSHCNSIHRSRIRICEGPFLRRNLTIQPITFAKKTYADKTKSTKILHALVLVSVFRQFLLDA